MKPIRGRRERSSGRSTRDRHSPALAASTIQNMGGRLGSYRLRLGGPSRLTRALNRNKASQSAEMTASAPRNGHSAPLDRSIPGKRWRSSCSMSAYRPPFALAAGQPEQSWLSSRCTSGHSVRGDRADQGLPGRMDRSQSAWSARLAVSEQEQEGRSPEYAPVSMAGGQMGSPRWSRSSRVRH
jgi:hypothetical protein